MDIILREDVENLGYKDDIVNVKNGYARNYLIPQGLGVYASPGERKMLEENLRQRAHKEAKQIEEAKKNFDDQISKTPYVCPIPDGVMPPILKD